MKSTSEHIEDPQYHKFCMGIRRLVRHMIQRGILDQPAQVSVKILGYLTKCIGQTSLSLCRKMAIVSCTLIGCCKLYNRL